MHIRFSFGSVHLTTPRGVSPIMDSSIALAHLLDVQPGESVLDLGCGSGLFSVVSAKMGAKRVIAVDIDERAYDAARENAKRNGVADCVEVRMGSWYEPVLKEEKFDVIVANPPQTPGPTPFGPKYGGEDGTMYLREVIEGASKFLSKNGRLWLLVISLADSGKVWALLEEHFSDVKLVTQTDRSFTQAEYDGYSPGLLSYLQGLQGEGAAMFQRGEGEGEYVFQNLFFRASQPRLLFYNSVP